MTKFVKNFIEKYIVAIETADWKTIVHKWCEEADYCEDNYTDGWLQELESALQILGYNFREDAEFERKQCLLEYIDKSFAIQMRLIDDEHRQEVGAISWFEVIISVPSTLLFTSPEVEQMLKEVSTKYDLVYDGKFYRRRS